MASPTSAAGGEIEELLNRAERLLQQVRDKLRELVTKINETLSSIPAILIPDVVIEGIQAGIRKMNELFDQLVSKMQEFFNSPGWPPALFAAGDQWLSAVAGPSAETENRINANKLAVDNYWKGSAAEAYKETLDTQQPAFAAVVDLARKIEQCLHDAGWGIIKFWVAVGVALVALAAGIATAIGLAVSGVGAPGAPAAAIGALLGALGAISAGAWAVFVEFQGVKDQADTLREESRYNTAFDGDQWPRATAEGQWQAD